MGKIDTIIDALCSSSDFSAMEYDHQHRNAAAWDAVTSSNGELKEARGIQVLFENSRSFLGSGADSSVMRCTIDFDRLSQEYCEEMLVDMMIHDWYSENPEGGFSSYDKVRKEKDSEIESLAAEEIRDSLVSRIRKMGFQRVNGRVYKAVATVSLKKIGEAEVGNRRQMHQEFLYGLNHPNLLGVVFAFLSNNHLVQVEEWGGNRRWESLQLAERIKVVLDVAKGVQYLHETYGVIHRDIKPSNVLISGRNSPRAKLADFSIVKMRDLQDRGLHTRTESGKGIGTPCFVAPEQCRGEPNIRSDVYGLGALLYAYVTKKNPADQSQGIAKSYDPALITDDSALNRRLRLVMAGCLQPNHSERYPSAGLVAEDIESVLHGKEPQNVLKVVSGLHYSLRNVKRYAANVFDKFDHDNERAVTAELVTQQPVSVRPPVKRSYAKGCGVVVLAALALGTCTVLANPYGYGDKLVEHGTNVCSKVESVYDSAKNWLNDMLSD